MFLFPFLVQNEPVVRLEPDRCARFESSAGYDPAASHAAENTEQMRSLNVPFCMNIMAGGRYQSKRSITFTSISSPEHFHLERNETDTDSTTPAEKNVPGVDDNWGIKTHQHDFFELMYVLEGSVEQRIENGCYFYEKGRACLMNRSTRHFEVVGTHYFVIYLCLSKEYVRELVDTEQTEGLATGLLHNFFTSNLEEQAQYHRDYLDFLPVGSGGKGPAQVEALLESMAQELLLKQTGYTHILRGVLERLFSYLQDDSLYEISQITLGNSTESLLFNKVTQLMEQNPGKVTRSILAEQLNYSSDYINRVVKKHSGMSISEYDRIIRLKKAKELFANSDQSITSIITSLGFENKTFFYGLFQKKYGMTPMEYRREHQRN